MFNSKCNAKYQRNIASIFHTQKKEEKVNWNKKNLNPNTVINFDHSNSHIGSLQCKFKSQNTKKFTK